MDYPPYPGVMTWRMRKHMEKWMRDSIYDTEDPRYQQSKQRELESFWKKECDSARADAILKAYKENYYDTLRQQKSDKFMVTINVQEEAAQKLPDLADKCAKWTTQKHIKDYEYAFEQRGDTMQSMGTGTHIHAIISTDSTKSEIIKRTASTFKAFIGSPQSIDVRPIPMDLLDQKRSYIRGVKKSDEKKRKCVIDKIWRHQNNLREVYSSNGLEETYYPSEDLSEACRSHATQDGSCSQSEREESDSLLQEIL